MRTGLTWHPNADNVIELQLYAKIRVPPAKFVTGGPMLLDDFVTKFAISKSLRIFTTHSRDDGVQVGLVGCIS